MDHTSKMFGGVGLGTFPFASPFSQMSPADRTSILGRFFDRGGEYIDTAPTYGNGEVEMFLGEYLSSKRRDGFRLSTSCGYYRDVSGRMIISGKPEHIAEDLSLSLDRLQLDWVDSYISHVPDPNTPKVETAQKLCEIRESGKAKLVGVANVTATELQEYLRGGCLDVVHLRFSYFNRSNYEELRDICQENNIKIVAYQVIERGILTSRGVHVKDLGPQDLRRRKPEFDLERYGIARSAIESHLVPISDDTGISLEELMTRWCLSQPGIGLVQIGATRAEQVANLPIRSDDLPKSLLDDLETAYSDILWFLKERGYESLHDVMGLGLPTPQSATGS